MKNNKYKNIILGILISIFSAVIYNQFTSQLDPSISFDNDILILKRSFNALLIHIGVTILAFLSLHSYLYKHHGLLLKLKSKVNSGRLLTIFFAGIILYITNSLYNEFLCNFGKSMSIEKDVISVRDNFILTIIYYSLTIIFIVIVISFYKKISNKINIIIKWSTLSYKGRILPFFSNHIYAISFFTIFLVSFSLFSGYIFGDEAYLFINEPGTDTIKDYYPRYYISSNVNTDYTFTKGIGRSTLPDFKNEIFSWLYHLIGAKYISTFTVYIAFLKLFFAGIFAFLWLKQLQLSNYITLIGSILFALNGYLILWGQHDFVQNIVFIPLLLYFLEKWIQDKKWVGLCLSISFFAIEVYTFYMAMILFGLYFIYRIIYIGKKRQVLFYLKTIAIGLLGITIAFPWLIESILNIINSDRVELKESNNNVKESIFANLYSLQKADYYISLVFRFFTNNAFGVGQTYIAYWNYYASPQIYIGTLPLLIIPQIFRKSEKRKLILNIVLVLFILLLLTFPFFARVFNGMQEKVQYRWTYIIIVLLLTVSMISFNRIYKTAQINFKLLIITSFIIISLIIYVSFDACDLYKSKGLDIDYFYPIIFRVAVFLPLYILCLYILIKKRRQEAKYLLLLFIVIELLIEHYPTLYKRRNIEKDFESKGKYFYDGTISAIKWINSTDPSFHRVIKNYYSIGCNDAVVQNYNGVTIYNSMINSDYRSFLLNFDVKLISPKRVYYFNDRPIVNTLLNVKYALSKNGQFGSYYNKIGEIDKVSIHKNKYYLPLGYSYSYYIRTSDFKELNTKQKEIFALNSIIVNDEDINLITSRLPQIKNISNENILSKKIKDVSNDSYNTFFKNGVLQLKEDTLRVKTWKDDYFSGNITLNTDKILNISIPYSEKWELYINNEPSEFIKTNFCFIGIPLQKGNYEITLTYENKIKYLYITIIGFTILLLIVLLNNKKTITTAITKLSDQKSKVINKKLL